MSTARFGAFVAVVFVLTAAAVVSADPPATDVPALIDKLTEVADSDIGYSPSAWGHPFLPLDRNVASEVRLLFQKPEVPSDTLRAIVKQGAAAVPDLIKHLDDKRPTKIKVTHDFGPLGGLFFADVCDYNARTAKADPNSKRSGDDDADSRPGPDKTGGHVLTVGDLCFVGLGQIVNRDFDAVRYQPTAIVIASSPTAAPALAAAVKKEWAGLTPKRHKAALIADFLTPDSDERRIGACKRLAYYYPEALEPLALKILAQPTYDRWDVEKFVQTDLYGARGLKEIHDRFDDYIARHGEASRDGILLQLFDDLQWLEAKERGARNEPADKYGDKPRRLLIELFHKDQDVKSNDVPRVDTLSTGAKAVLIEEGLIYDNSRKVDSAVRDLLAATDDDYFALACCNRLVGRGFDADIERYWKRRRPLIDTEFKKQFGNILSKMGWTRLHTAVDRGDVDEVRRRIADRLDVNAAAKDGRTPLHLAAEAGDREIVRALLDGKADLNPKDASGRTPVERAAREDSEDVVSLLAERGCDLPDVLSAASVGRIEVVEALLKKDPKQARATNAHGGTPLHLAARRGDVKTAALLLAAGAAGDARDEEGRTPLHFALAGGHEEAARLLLENKADSNALPTTQEVSPLHLAILSGKSTLVFLLLKYKANPNVLQSGENGAPLHLAVAKGLPDMVAALLDGGAAVDSKNMDGWTPLHLAARAGREDMARILLDHKADANAPGRDGRRPLHEAAAAHHPKVVPLLLDHNADVAAKDETGRTPLHYAAEGLQPEIAALLLDRGAKANVRSDDGETPLCGALQIPGGTEVVRVLLEHKATPNPVDQREGMEPLHLAVKNGDRKAVRMLLDHGAVVNARDDEGKTPLHWAAGGDDAGLIEELLAHGAAVNVRAHDGSAPLHAAVENGRVGAVKTLLDHKADPNLKNDNDETPLDLLPTEGEETQHAAEIRRLLEKAMPRK